jgi:hypothetical protein
MALMAVRIVITPGDSMWWLMRPEFLAYVDEIELDPADYERVKSEKSDSAYRAVVWKRLSVLGDNGLVRLSPVKVDWNCVTLQAERKIREVLSDEEKARAFVADMIFAYRYWIEFNQQRLAIMPVDDDYAESVNLHMPVWADDLDMLMSLGKKALIDRPEIVEQTARSILIRVASLREIGRSHSGLALASLKEFQPFLKYIDCAPDRPLPAGVPEAAEMGYLPPEHAAGWRDLPVDPDLAFLSFDLSKRALWERLSSIRQRCEGHRAVLNALLMRVDEMRYASAEGVLDARVAGEYARLAGELDDLEFTARQSSPYLRGAFYGLTLVPTPALSRLLGAAASPGRGRPAADEAACELASLGGAPAWSAIQESLLDLSRVGKLPKARPRRRKLPHRPPAFWRGGTGMPTPPA